jgi:hypothetical protein
MNAAAPRALADVSGQVEVGSAALTDSFQTAAGERLVAQSATMRLVDKINESPAFGKGSCTASCRVAVI